jgi:ATP-dependent Lon protease
MVDKKRKKKASKKLDTRPELLSLLPLKEMVAFPGLVFPVYVTSAISTEAINYAIENSGLVVLALLTGDSDKPNKSNLKRVGTVARVVHSAKLANGQIRVRLHIENRVKINSFLKISPYVLAKVSYIVEQHHVKLSARQEKLMEDVKKMFQVVVSYDETIEEDSFDSDEYFEPGVLGDFIASHLPLYAEEGQSILEELDPFKRLELVKKALNTRLEELDIRERIITKARAQLGKGVQEDLLREQLRQIQAELGFSNDDDDELTEFKSRIEKLKMPAQAKKEAERHLRRLQFLHSDSSEAALARTYLSWLLELPWSKRTKDRIDLEEAKQILDQDHYGLTKAKERILDFLGARKLRGDLRGPILLFVGPPGVGKTSLGRSIASAVGRKFVRIALGGLRDEAEIRGHRRTYVGALPGRIIQGIKTANSLNPVFLLDEIDKVGSSFRGDPSSVLLEVLDSEQNKTFEDHYINVPFNLSEVMFIATANLTDTIPPALLDRMEVIEISGYTLEEKTEISKRYLIMQEMQQNGLADYSISISDSVIHKLINSYTQESGVRELHRIFGTVFRKIARRIAEGEVAPKQLTLKLVEEFLGPQKYLLDVKGLADQIGVVTGLAWTSVGGTLLTVEVAMTSGKGQLSLTGQLGDVMRESGAAALTYVLSHAESLGIDEKLAEKSNFHVHVPQGATPKDGPSAGIAIATALMSLLTKNPVSRNVAMTGEITLRGRVLAVGGLREKALAALRAGISVVIIPKENESELVEFPKYLLDQVTFVPVETIEEVFKVALVSKPLRKGSKRSILRI